MVVDRILEGIGAIVVAIVAMLGLLHVTGIARERPVVRILRGDEEGDDDE